MGLGFALLVVEQLSGQTLPLGIRRGGPLLVDVDTWLPGGMRSRPDLVVFFGGAKQNTTYVIEANGNSSGRDKAVPDDGFTAHAIKVKHVARDRLRWGRP